VNAGTVDDLATRLSGLGDWNQRAAVFAEMIQQDSPELAACLFSQLIARTIQTRYGKFTISLQSAFLATLTARWALSHRIHTREAAAAWHDDLTLTFLVDARCEEDDEAFPVPVYNRDRTLTLGERKTLAGSSARRSIEMALLDPHPAVIERLLDNPRLTEPDIIRIAARAKIPRANLCALAMHPKWRERKGVISALVQNRRLPVNYGLTLLPFLGQPILASIRQDNRLDEELRAAAALLIAVADQQNDTGIDPHPASRH
jgi:hypothetical protein